MPYEKPDISYEEVIKRRTIGSQVAVLSRLDRAFYATVLQEYDLGTNDMAVLLQLDYFGELRQEQIVRFLSMDKAVLSRITKRLTGLGYIYTTKNKADGRMRYLGLTEMGRSIIPHIKESTKRWISLITEDILEEELQITRNTLNKMIENTLKTNDIKL